MTLDPETYYLQLKRLVASMPDFGEREPLTADMHEWVGRAVALVELARDFSDVVQLKIAADGLLTAGREYSTERITAILHRALARAEMNAPVSAQGAFIAAGDTLNAFAAVAKVLARAKATILMVDAYADQTIITGFAVTAPEGVAMRILGADREARKMTLRPAVANWVQQFGASRPIEVRVVPQAELHDRLILIDGAEAWFAGQSFNSMAQKSHTSIEQSDPELAAMKIAAYDAIWLGAQQL